MKFSFHLMCLGLSGTVLLSGCGGGSSASTAPAPVVAGVKTPSTVSVVTAN